MDVLAPGAALRMPALRIAIVCAIVAALLAAIPAPSQAATQAERAPDQLIVRVAPAITIGARGQAAGQGAGSLDATLAAIGARAAQPIGAGSGTYRVHVRPGQDLGRLSQRLAHTSGVVYAEPNAMRASLLTPNDPVARQQWALRNLQAFEAWDITTGGEVTIALLDTGVSTSHPDLRGRVLPGYDFANNDPDASDDEGHGTYTAGVAAAEGNNGTGVAGVCWKCRILPVKVLTSRGRGDDATIATGIRWAADQGARIISMSLGGEDDTQVLRDAVAYARQHGALLIAASGNGQARGNRPAYPAAYPEVLAVSATDGSDVVTGFSTTGDFVDISAPGVGVWSTYWDAERGDGYAAANGTSAACPYVAGAAALVWSIRPDLNADQVAEVLTRSADDRGAPGRDPQDGWGRLNLLHAVQLASDPNLSFSAPAPSAPAAPAGANAFAPVPPPSDGARFFPETSHTLRGAFRGYWEQQGGLPIFGFPISEEFVERGEDGRDYTVQYFERHRFELHPEHGPPYNVQLSRLGAATLANAGRDWNAFPRSGPQPGCVYFPQTDQSVCEPFLSYWRSHGLEFDGRRGKSAAESLALFGLPLSPPQLETLPDGQTVTVQWFERARFEDHGEQGVLLGLLSSDLAQRRGWR
jgi:type VII secretion-associated serine protease mycosin